MNRFLLLIGLFSTFYYANAQVAIGKANISTNSVSLEFGNIANNADFQRGILLPWVTSVNDIANATPGTLVFDTTDKKIKYLKGGATPVWFDLTLGSNGTVDTSLQDALISNNKAKVSIGENNSGADGILVLEDTNKAMVLPLVDSYKSIENPSPGMMAYDVSNNMLCVFNGTQWTFWKEN